VKKLGDGSSKPFPYTLTHEEGKFGEQQKYKVKYLIHSFAPHSSTISNLLKTSNFDVEFSANCLPLVNEIHPIFKNNPNNYIVYYGFKIVGLYGGNEYFTQVNDVRYMFKLMSTIKQIDNSLKEKSTLHKTNIVGIKFNAFHKRGKLYDIFIENRYPLAKKITLKNNKVIYKL
tara:strand:- start:81 stop:599 length:519 start_codon:yes stop_codon:yes gene_type:complete